MSVEALAGLAAIRPASATGNAASRRVEASLSDIEAALAARIEVLHAAMTDLRRARAKLPGCHDCRKRPTHANCMPCPMASELLACRVMHVVWDQETTSVPTAPIRRSTPSRTS